MVIKSRNTTNMSDSIVIIPTYNEKENIEAIIRAVFGLEKKFHILIIDDGSPDGTAAIVKRMQQEFPDRLFLVERSGKLGLGTAYICGFKWAIAHKYDFVLRWMLISVTTRTTCLGCMRLARSRGLTWRSALAIAMA